MRKLAAAFLLSLLTAGCAGAEDGEELTVAAASGMRPVLDRLAAEHERRTGVEVTIGYGSSGQLSQQVLNGAPFDLFVSASDRYTDPLVEEGRAGAGDVVVFAEGRLAVWSGSSPAPRIQDLPETGGRIAIANPEHAPYGQVAWEALERAGVLGEVRDRLVYGASVAGAMQLAESGNAGAGIVARSLAVEAESGQWVPVPASLHEPVLQVAVVLGENPGQATGFVDLLTGPEGRDLLAEHGFAASAGSGGGG